VSTDDDEIWGPANEPDLWGKTKLHNPSRREMLRLGLGAAVGAGVAGAAGIGVMTLARPIPGHAALATREPAPSSAIPSSTTPSSTIPSSPSPHSTIPSSPSPRPKPRVSPPTRPAPIPAWAKPWSAPIYSIGNFLDRSPRTAFPRNALMLTVDDGPDPTWTPKYLALFAKHNIRATFFMIGAHAQASPHLVRAVHSAGHVIGNHTWTHDEALRTRPLSRIRRELATTSSAIEDACGVVPRQFRAPGGVWGPRVFEVLGEMKMMPIAWDIDPRDWALPGTTAITHTLLTAGRHDIALCHDGGGNRAQTYAALKTVIPQLKSRGYEFVTLPSPAAL